MPDLAHRRLVSPLASIRCLSSFQAASSTSLLFLIHDSPDFCHLSSYLSHRSPLLSQSSSDVYSISGRTYPGSARTSATSARTSPIFFSAPRQIRFAPAGHLSTSGSGRFGGGRALFWQRPVCFHARRTNLTHLRFT